MNKAKAPSCHSGSAHAGRRRRAPVPRSWSQPPAWQLASRTSLHPARTSSRQQPATQPQPSSPIPAVPAALAGPGRRAGRQRGHRDRDGAVKQLCPGPGRLRSLNTYTLERTPANRLPGGVGKALPRLFIHSFSQRQGSLRPGASILPSQGANCATARHPATHSHRVLSPGTHNPRDSHFISTARVASAPGPLPPGSPASPPRRPGSPPPAPPRGSDLPRSGRRTQAGQGRRRHCWEAPATPESRRLPRRGGAQGGDSSGGGAGRRKKEGAGSKSSHRSGLSRAPISSQARPRHLPPRTGSHGRRRRRALASQPGTAARLEPGFWKRIRAADRAESG